MLEFNLIENFEITGLICSLILCAGLYQIGSLIFKVEIINKIISQISDIKYQKIFISTNLILLVFYPIILFSNKINFIPILSVVIFIFGFFKIIFKFKKKLRFQKIKFNKNNGDKYLVLLVLVSLFFLSLSPNTHGDSLGYHFVVAKKLLSSGSYPADITHFHSLLTGSGEIIIAIGLFFGSEQFGNLIQFSGLISIFGIFRKIDKKKKYFFLLLILTSPVIIFLSSTAKPQLFHLCSSAVIFTLYFFENSKPLKFHEKNLQILISVFILIVSVTAKFNFLLSSLLIGLVILYDSIKSKNFFYFFVISTLGFLIFYLPIILWKFNNFGGNFFQYFYSPLPLNIIGLEEFQQYLVRFIYGGASNPLEILFTTNFSEFTNSIGIAFLYLFLMNFKNNKGQISVLITLLYIFLVYVYGQFTGRSFLEPLFWILLICARYGVTYRLKLFEFLCRIQALFVISGIFFGIYSLFPGSLTSNLKDRVLSQNANGYGLFKWANTKLKKDDVVFSMHRSISLGESNYISMDFIPFVDFRNVDSKIIVDAIYKKKPNYLLTFGYSSEKPILREFKNCVGKLIFYQKNIGKFEARNPFNRGANYHGFIFQLKKNEIPACIKD
tara:strand:+ start:7 stop:1839 length:1833 start_codon:yes stop_codon:yes gene_type:complete